jgi:adenylate cyclase
VVFTSKAEEGLADYNCLKIFFQIKKNVTNRTKYYLEKSGTMPSFKSGLHFGEVITAQIGDIKREIVYNGDVMNTSARIQEQSNTSNRELLVSGKLLKKLNINNEYNAEKMDVIKLRGKVEAVELYSLNES